MMALLKTFDGILEQKLRPKNTSVLTGKVLNWTKTKRTLTFKLSRKPIAWFIQPEHEIKEFDRENVSTDETYQSTFSQTIKGNDSMDFSYKPMNFFSFDDVTAF